MITFSNVRKSYSSDTYAVDSLNLEIRDGEFFVLIGPSGCGKTTTLKMINRLIDVSDGTILIDGKEISKYEIHELRWEIGYVLQQIALFPHMTISENIAIVPQLKKWSKEKVGERVDELLNMVGLDPSVYRNRKPHELSGGQQQRIGVARALAANPPIILMDEPFSALDPISREKLQDDVLELQRSIRKTIVFVTHDIQEATKLGDRICIMKAGKVVQVGTPTEVMHNPVNDFVKDFVGVHVPKDSDINLEKLVCKTSEMHLLNSTAAISVSAPLTAVLETLATEESVPVEKDGQVIGIINREIIVQYLSGRMQKRGRT